MSDVLNHFNIHDLSSLFLKTVTLSEHTISIALLWKAPFSLY